jgi:hypothetical protein
LGLKLWPRRPRKSSQPWPGPDACSRAPPPATAGRPGGAVCRSVDCPHAKPSSSPPAPRESAPDSSAEINSSPLPSRGGRPSCVRACVPLLPPLSCFNFFSGLIRQAVASPLASASSWSAIETSRCFLLLVRVGSVLNSYRIDPPPKIENSSAQYFFLVAGKFCSICWSPP